jgi:hypothetical protein
VGGRYFESLLTRIVYNGSVTRSSLLEAVGITFPAKKFETFFLVSLDGVRLSPLGTSATVCLLYQPRMIDDDDCGAVGGMRFGRGNRSIR